MMFRLLHDWLLPKQLFYYIMAHLKNDTLESKRHFQLERIILFSDAVFAIAITLLILEIKIPHLEDDLSEPQLIHALVEIIPDLIGFLISFVVIGQFWTSHHRLFGYIINFDNGLLWLNLLMLLFVVIMPFTTRLNMQYGGLSIVWFIYSLNLALISISLLLLWVYISKRKTLSYIGNDVRITKYAILRSVAVTLIFLIGGLLTFLPWDWVKWSSRFSFVMIFPVLSVLKRRFNRTKAIIKR